MATKKCPMCAEEIQAEALVCRYCGARFDAGVPAGAVLPPPPSEPASPYGAAPAAPAAVPQGELREGIVPTGLQLFGFYLETIVVIVAMVVTVFGFGAGSLAWGESAVAWARPAPIFIVGVFIILIAWSIGVHALVPRRGRLTGTGASFRRTVKERYGVSQLLKRRGIVGGVVVSVLVWAAMEASAIYNYRTLLDDGWDLKPGIYAAIALPAVGIVAALMVLGRGRRVVRMDASGALYE